MLRKKRFCLGRCGGFHYVLYRFWLVQPVASAASVCDSDGALTWEFEQPAFHGACIVVLTHKVAHYLFFDSPNQKYTFRWPGMRCVAALPLLLGDAGSRGASPGFVLRGCEGKRLRGFALPHAFADLGNQRIRPVHAEYNGIRNRRARAPRRLQDCDDAAARIVSLINFGHLFDVRFAPGVAHNENVKKVLLKLCNGLALCWRTAYEKSSLKQHFSP